MAIFRYAVAAFLVALVSADGIGATAPEIRQRATPSSCSGEIIVNSQADADTGPISSCTEIDGNLIFDNAVGNITFPIIDHGGQLTTIYGSVYCRNNTALEGLELYGVVNIEGSIIVQNAASLVYVAAEQLDAVQSVTVTDVPSLLFLELSPGPVYLESLELGGSPMTGENFGAGLARLESVGDLYIHDCPNMSIPLDQPLQNVTNSLVVENNGLDFGIYSNILWIYNMTMRNVQSFELNKLVAVNNSLEISSCDGLTTIDFESLKSIGGDFYVANNPSLTGLGVPSATSIGGDWLGTPDPTTGGSITSQNNPSLRGFNFASLRGSGGFYLDGPWPSLASLNASFPALTSTPGGIVVVFDDEPGAGQGSAPPVQCNYEQSYAPRTWSSAFSCNGTAPKPNPKSSHGICLNVKDGISVGVAIIAVVAVLVL